MTQLSVLMVAFGLAMDAVAVCIVAATAGFVVDRRAMFRLAFHFGLFQTLMAIIGWVCGTFVEHQLPIANEWIASVLLAGVGVHMLWTAWRGESHQQRRDPTRGWTLIILATATSLDALCVGLSFALACVSIWLPSVLIGGLTAALCLVATGFGKRLRRVFARWAEVAGGVLLLLLAVWILLNR